jgi:hypothetical protein
MTMEHYSVFTKTSNYIMAVQVAKGIRLNGYKALIRKEEKVKGYPIYTVLTTADLHA